MVHDGDGCGGSQIMTASLDYAFWPSGWSKCSRAAFEEFLRSDKASCLINTANSAVKAYRSVESVCHEMYGLDATECNTTNADGNCTKVHCSLDGGSTCVVSSQAASDGMICGKKSICHDGQCFPAPEEWSNWSPFDDCSLTCGRGLQRRRRWCRTVGCSGQSVQYRWCKVKSCPRDLPEGRLALCAAYNKRRHRDGRYYDWRPYMHPDRKLQCELWCIPSGTREPVRLAAGVPDGLSCGSDDEHLCVNRKCEKLSCSGTFGVSEVGTDKCGVCGGNGSSCRVHSGLFLHHRQRTFTHHHVVRIPAGATRIFVKEENSLNCLALRSGLASDTYYLNGDDALMNSGMYEVAGALVVYQRISNVSETIFIGGPIKKSLDVMVLVQQRVVNITHRYQIDSDSVDYSPARRRTDYAWTYTEWSTCPRSCGGGQQTRLLTCEDKVTGLPVDTSMCGERPVLPRLQRNCNMQPCRPQWFAGDWVECSASCGGGKRRRAVYCVSDRDESFGGPKKVKKRHVRQAISRRQRRRATCRHVRPDSGFTILGRRAPSRAGKESSGKDFRAKKEMYDCPIPNVRRTDRRHLLHCATRSRVLRSHFPTEDARTSAGIVASPWR
eukprot:m.152991 g.152991  ORF g.152991 m.152991 type:complete len:610 (+) comp38611_c0_seq1:693-2522(+)